MSPPNEIEQWALTGNSPEEKGRQLAWSGWTDQLRILFNA